MTVVGRIASDEVVLELFKKKCLPVLLYGTEACPLKKSHKDTHILSHGFQFLFPVGTNPTWRP